MLTRLKHSAIAFAITVMVYQAYVLLAAPLIEPPQVAQVAPPLTEAEQQDALRATHKYRKLLSAYFPPGHWTLVEPPITAENGEAMLVIDEFNPRDDGQVRVKKCVILFFPGGRVRGEPPPTSAVVLEAPHGAVLQMDNRFKQGVGSLGRIQWGKLTGKITVRSDMHEPGPHDDLFLETRDLSLNEDLIYTKDLVEMQLGPHRARGRELEIRLVAIERGRVSTMGPNLGGIDSLEILKEVEAQLSPGVMQFGESSAARRSSPTAQPPIKITSKGRFRFDFPKQVASFNKNVRLTQVHPEGELDELLCETLSIYFANNDQTAAAVSALGKLSLGLIEALGSESAPVVLNAPSQRASAHCERLRFEPQPRRITLDRGPKVKLSYQGNEIEARQVQYTLPPENSPHRVGRLLAAGRGWLKAQSSDKPNSQPFEVFWSENMRLRLVNDQPVLSLNGRPKLDMVGMGQLWADHLDLYLRESAADGSEADLLPAEIVPERLVAGGEIAIDSSQLHGKVKALEVLFDYASGGLRLTGPDGEDSRGGRSRSHAPRVGRSVGDMRAYDIVGDTLEMLVTVRNKKPEVTSIDVDGKVVFNESGSNASGSPGSARQPLKVVADHLHIDHADSPHAEIKLDGKPATITAAGMSIRTVNLQINRGSSRAWVKAPGEIQMLVDRDLSGNPLPTPQPMTIRWQRGMDLDQDRITFEGNVQVQTGEGTLDTQEMVVKLSAPVEFDGASGQRPIEIAELECSGGVNAIFSQRDALGLASVQTIKLEESFNANLQTGELRGTGPGAIESVHLSNGKNPLGEPASAGGHGHLASTNPLSSPQAAQRLRFLGIEFVRGVQGNLNRRQVKVYGDVSAVYGPVDSWQQRIALTKRGMPGPDTIWINSQTLGVAESPLARLNRSQSSGLGPLELEATGDKSRPVTIEGPAGERGNFTTQSQLAKYDQVKKTFILEGTNQDPAKIMLQEYRGGQTSPTSARKITYHQESGNVNVEGLVSGQFRQLAPGR